MGYSHCWILAFFAGFYGLMRWNMLAGFLLTVVTCLALMAITNRWLNGR